MPTIDPAQYVSIQTGASLAGVTRLTLREAIKAGRVRGMEIDGYYFALRSACENFEKDPKGGGRPRATPAAAVVRPRQWAKKAAKATAGKVDPSKLCNVSRYWMGKLVQEGHVRGLQIDGQYFALRSAVEAYAANPAGVGRPRGGTHAS
jgi:hypothetical protein